jgi:hypothetical protein
MVRNNRLTPENLREHVDAWAAAHGSLTYARLTWYLENGDEFGRPVKITTLARAAKTSGHTMTKWVTVYRKGRKNNV